MAVYASGYSPQEYELKVERNNFLQYEILLQKMQLITGNIAVRQLSIEEIIDAGIDLSDIDNYHQYEVSLDMKFKAEPIPTEYKAVCAKEQETVLKTNSPNIERVQEIQNSNKTEIQIPKGAGWLDNNNYEEVINIKNKIIRSIIQ